MARLAKEWAEKTFSLPREVDVIERDLCNGFVLASILRQANLVNEDDIELVKDSAHPEEILKNFAVINNGLKQVGITLTKKQVAEVNYGHVAVSVLSSYVRLYVIDCIGATW